MAYFSFISDEDLHKAVSVVLNAAERAANQAADDFEKNSLDPFGALFSVAYNDISLDDWNELERERQAQKSIQNTIGEFHQNLLGSFHNWTNPGRGGSVDLVNESSLIIAEIKNKHNTMNAAAANDTYAKLANHLKYDRKGYTAYLVQIVPKRGANYDTNWSPNHKTLALRDDIRKIDGESFYDIASGENDTLSRIFEVMPSVIASLTGKNPVKPDVFAACKELFDSVYK